MNHRAQLQFEAIVCLACFFGLLAVALHSLNQFSQESSKAVSAITAKNNSLLCSTAIDSIYANSVNSLVEERLPCELEAGRKVKSAKGRIEKSSFCLPESVKLVQAAEQTIVSVKLNEHYR